MIITEEIQNINKNFFLNKKSKKLGCYTHCTFTKILYFNIKYFFVFTLISTLIDFLRKLRDFVNF